MATLHLVVRLFHVAGVAVLLGGAALVWGRYRIATADPAGDGGAPALATAAAYEWLFWGAVGLAVLTGVGNLGGMAPAIQGPGTDWGFTFTIKLAGVGGLLVGSLVRTLAVARWRATAVPAEGRIEATYAVTSVYLLCLLGLAEVLAHG